ncbi:hypothetical protein QCD60_02840 [Pokkaliibacter sp. MBI-7]|uniref:hypothetical protein n=1 Tax=Pokkaliibacter sp. MBI-7 TaxID=3040600 RepID=UPI0024471945|nr:hypothetical protein [Pokkaliibacter sp. MBI-7]MDH2431495.1 hypothetical protein [Pokkaliibacter sp. MBI-7]
MRPTLPVLLMSLTLVLSGCLDMNSQPATSSDAAQTSDSSATDSSNAGSSGSDSSSTSGTATQPALRY